MCGCSKVGYCIGNLLYIFEKLASCFAITAVVTCLITTLILMLAFGIGLGYNYCFVDFKTKGLTEPDNRQTYTTTTGTTPVIVNSEEKIIATGAAISSIIKDDFVIPTYRMIDESATTEDDFKIEPLIRKQDSLEIRRKSAEKSQEATRSLPILFKRTMIVPLHVGVDFSSLLSKIRALNKNVTLEIIAT